MDSNGFVTPAQPVRLPQASKLPPNRQIYTYTIHSQPPLSTDALKKHVTPSPTFQLQLLFKYRASGILTSGHWWTAIDDLMLVMSLTPQMSQAFALLTFVQADVTFPGCPVLLVSTQHRTLLSMKNSFEKTQKNKQMPISRN